MATSGPPLRPPQPFRFMDLPTELRLKVYERLPRTVKHTHIPTAKTKTAAATMATSATTTTTTTTTANQSPSGLILVTQYVPISILATCREVHKEASKIIKRLIQTFILEHEPRILEVDAPAESIYKMLAAVSREWHIFTAPNVCCGPLPSKHKLTGTRVWH
jgi:hypothetical protein